MRRFENKDEEQLGSKRQETSTQIPAESHPLDSAFRCHLVKRDGHWLTVAEAQGLGVFKAMVFLFTKSWGSTGTMWQSVTYPTMCLASEPFAKPLGFDDGLHPSDLI